MRYIKTSETMLTIATAAANPLNNCQRLYPSMDRSPFSARRGKATVTGSHDFISDTQAELRGAMPRAFMVPPVSNNTARRGYCEHVDGICMLLKRDISN